MDGKSKANVTEMWQSFVFNGIFFVSYLFIYSSARDYRLYTFRRRFISCVCVDSAGNHLLHEKWMKWTIDDEKVIDDLLMSENWMFNVQCSRTGREMITSFCGDFRMFCVFRIRNSFHLPGRLWSTFFTTLRCPAMVLVDDDVRV